MSIIVHDLSKSYGAQLALDGVSFEIAPGQIVGLLGPNGAGKSTCMKILSGYIRNFSGRGSVAGHDVSSDLRKCQSRLGYLPEHNPLYLDLYVREALAFVASLHPNSQAASRIDEVIDVTGLASEKHKNIRSLSKGYRQRVGLAQALLHDPEVLILDEPTTGLDPNQLKEIRDLIRHLGKNKTVLFSSHILSEVEALCDRVVVLNKGKVVADRPLDVPTSDLCIRVEFDRPVSTEAFEAIPHRKMTWQDGHHLTLTCSSERDPRAAIFDLAVGLGVRIVSMSRDSTSITDLFSQLTKEDRG